MRRPALLGAAAVFALLLIRPAYMSALRRETKDLGPMNGRFTPLVDQLRAMRVYDESRYAARVHQVLLHGRPVSPYWRERRSLGEWLPFFIPYYLLAGVGALCAGDMALTWIVAAALVAALWFLFLFAVFERFSGRTHAALPLAFFAILFPDLWVWLLDVNFNLSLTWDRFASALYQTDYRLRPLFYRLPAPFLSLLLLAVLLAYASRLAGPKPPKPAAAAALGLGFGLMVFVHAFEFAFGMGTLVLLASLIFIFKLPGRRAALGCLAAALAVCAGYALLMRGLMTEEGRRGMAQITALTASRRFYLTSLIHVLFAGLALRIRMKEEDAGLRGAWLVLAAAQGSAFLWRNAQVVLGRQIEPFHFITLGSLAGAMIPLCWAARAARWDKKTGLALASLVLLLTLGNEKAAARRGYRMFGLPGGVDGGLRWLEKNAEKDALVVSLSMQANTAIPLYTQAVPALSPMTAPLLIPFTREQYLERVAAILKTAGADTDRFISARWLRPSVKDAVIGPAIRRQAGEGVVDLTVAEAAEWFYCFSFEPGDGPVLEGQAQLRRLAKAARPLERPYYLWLAAEDRTLLARSPESSGGRLVYANGDVSLYAYGAL